MSFFELVCVLWIIRGMFIFDGVGVCLICVIGGLMLFDFDLFLLFDEFGIDCVEDYIVGFLEYLYRGFEIVIYMFDGCMWYCDNYGNEGLLILGSVQWMIVGRGLVYLEMFEQESGQMCGF